MSLSAVMAMEIKVPQYISLTLGSLSEFDAEFEALPMNRKPEHHETHILIHFVDSQRFFRAELVITGLLWR